MANRPWWRKAEGRKIAENQQWLFTKPLLWISIVHSQLGNHNQVWQACQGLDLSTCRHGVQPSLTSMLICSEAVIMCSQHACSLPALTTWPIITCFYSKVKGNFFNEIDFEREVLEGSGGGAILNKTRLLQYSASSWAHFSWKTIMEIGKGGDQSLTVTLTTT